MRMDTFCQEVHNSGRFRTSSGSIHQANSKSDSPNNSKRSRENIIMVFKSIFPDVHPPEEYQNSFSLFTWRQLDKHGQRQLMVDYESGRTWTGAQMKSACSNLASFFIDQLGLKPRDCVAQFCLHTDYLQLVALSAILSGASSFYWSPEDPARERATLITILKPKIVCTNFALFEDLKLIRASTGIDFTILLMDDDGNHSDQVKAPEVYGLHTHALKPRDKHPSLPVIVSPNDPCYLIMTSGSTGNPKPLARSHKNSLYLCFTAPLVPDLWHLHENIVMAGHLPPDHGTGVFCIKMTIALGYKLIIMQDYDEATCLNAIERYKITDMMLGSALLHNLILSKKVEGKDISSLVNLIAVGSPLVCHDTLVAFMDKHPQLSIRQAFGMTEAAFISIVPRSQAREKRRTVGYIIPNIKIKLLDLETNEEITEFDKKGELYLSTPTISPGYIGEQFEQQNEAVFMSNGFYRSYDMASMSKDSQLTLYGRRNEVLDLYDGWKVLPSEIEEYITQLPGVKEVAVIGVASKTFPGCHDVRAFVALEEGAKLTVGDVEKWVRDGLSSPKHLSGGCIILDSLPRGSVGKVNKKLLRIM